MNQEQANLFIANNKEALKLLSQKLQEIDTVRGVTTIKEMQARQLAIKMVTDWMTDIFGIAIEKPIKDTDENLYMRLEKGRIEPK